MVVRRRIALAGTLALSVLAACGGTTAVDARKVSDGTDGGADASVARPLDASTSPDSGISCKVEGGSVGFSIAYEIDFADPGTRILDVAPRPSGELLVARPDSVAILSPTGTFTRSIPFDKTVAVPTLSPTGNAYFTLGDGSVHVFDDSGRELSTASPATTDVALPESILGSTFSNSGELLVLTFGLVGLEREIPTRREIRKLTGDEVATMPADYGFPNVPATDDALFVADAATLTRYPLPSGPPTTIATPNDILGYELSNDGSRVALVLTGSKVAHAVSGSLLPVQQLDSAVWDLHITPSGAWTIATEVTPGRVTRFSDGTFEGTSILDLEYVNSAAVNERGEIALGGQDANRGSHLIFLDAAGDFAFRCDGPADDDAFTPHVRFTEDGEAVFVIFRDRFLYLRLVRT